nr:hypothetical protein [uncultured Brevundimonas sp.]
MREESFQFDRVGYQPPNIPQWMRGLRDMLETIAPLLKWALWIGLGLLAAAIIYAIVREILRLRGPRAKPAKPRAQVETEWRPDVQAARDLLASADALAAEGHYAEAAHLILLRSVEDIGKHQPRALRISLTTREIASLTCLPDAARPAFMNISQLVERSLFGGATVNADDFTNCRRAYEAFALPQGWRA